MLKALLKKQFLELNQFYFFDRKTGKARSAVGSAGMIALYAAIFLLLGAALGSFERFLYQGLALLALEWLYFVFCSLFALALGVFGSVFNTYAGLYLAKDNDLLLAMPIPPAKLLAVRMTGVYATGLLYEAIVFLPAMVVPWLCGGGRVGPLCAQLAVFFLLGVLILALTCALGWIVALVSAKLKNRSFVAVILSLVFIAVYYFFYYRLSFYIQTLIANAQAIADSIRAAWPVYALGMAACGDGWSLVALAVFSAALFGVLMYAMSRSFLRIATASIGGRKAVYRRRAARRRSVSAALFHRELRRFASSANYMLNCGLGLVILLAVSVAALVKLGWVRAQLSALLSSAPALADLLPVAAAAALCLAISMNFISAPSVALEGKTIWLVQSLPVAAQDVLRAKARLHFWLNAPVALAAGIVFSVVLRLDVSAALLLNAAALAYAALTGLAGLVFGLKRPNLSWTNEAVPIKQSAASMTVLFGGWLLSAAMAAGYYPLIGVISPAVYLAAATALFLGGSALCLRWLDRRGAAIFAAL